MRAEPLDEAMTWMDSRKRTWEARKEMPGNAQRLKEQLEAR